MTHKERILEILRKEILDLEDKRKYLSKSDKDWLDWLKAKERSLSYEK